MASSDNENHASKLVNDQEITGEIEEKEKETTTTGGGGEEEEVAASQGEMEEEAAPGGGGGGEEIEAAAAPEGGGGGEEIEAAAAAAAAEEIGENSSRSAPEEVEYWRYIPFQKAALRGDWSTAWRFFCDRSVELKAKITPDKETIFHVAIRNRSSINFVGRLLRFIATTAALGDIYDRNALHVAAYVGNTEAAVILVQELPSLLSKCDMSGWLPIHWAANKGHKDTLLYLMSVPEDPPDYNPFAARSGVLLLKELVASEFYEVAFELVGRNSDLAKPKEVDGTCVLEVLASKASSFPSGTRLNCWERLIYYYVPVKLESDARQEHDSSDIESPDNNNSQVTGKEHDRSDIENPVNNNSQVTGKIPSWALFLRGKFIFVYQKFQAVLWKVLQLLVPHIKHIQEKKLMHLQAIRLLKCLCVEIRSSNDLEAYKSFYQNSILTAARLGIHEVVEEIVESYPQAVWLNDSENFNIFQLAVIKRHESIFNLVYQMSDYKQDILTCQDTTDNNILHLAGQLAPHDKLNLVPGAALQMQRELQWFKEVEKFVPHSYKAGPNKDKKTPAMIFAEKHAELVKEGEKWMKDTATSCTIAATLIATIAFAAAITVPGGNNGGNGLPIFFQKKAFIVFVISNAISLFTSTTSLLMFLSILTSRFPQENFLHVLPKRLIIGLITLFLSISAMIVAFSSTLYLVLGHNETRILIPIIALACLPITSFVLLQFPLLVDLISSTYGRGIFGKQSNRSFY